MKKCVGCLRKIDEDSLFCKFCGKKVVTEIDYTKENARLVKIFNSIYHTLYTNSSLSKDEFDKEYDKFKEFQDRNLRDKDYYSIIVYVVFYSGFKASTVDKYAKTISSYFSDYMKVMKYTFSDIEEMMNDKNMIRNRSKISACIKNANVMNEIVAKHGSFRKYITSYNPSDNDECLNKLRKDLKRSFSYLSDITTYHFLTDIGLDVLKPDRVIMRIFYRLGFVDSSTDYWNATIVGRNFSKALNLPIRYIDIILVMYGQLNQDRIESICTEKTPNCIKCGVRDECKYNNELMFHEVKH